MTLTEGFDVPSVNSVILARPTQSIALYHQMVGRGLRLSPETEKRDCLVICQSGNVSRHGFIEEVKSVSLDPGEDSTGKEAPKKIPPLNFRLIGKKRLRCSYGKHLKSNYGKHRSDYSGRPRQHH